MCSGLVVFTPATFAPVGLTRYTGTNIQEVSKVSIGKRKKLSTISGRVQPLAKATRLEAGDSWRQDKAGSSTARGYTYRWQKESKEYLEANPLCVRCKAQGFIVAAACVDHRQPHQGNQELFWNHANWQGLCVRCHNQWKQRAEHAQRNARRKLIK